MSFFTQKHLFSVVSIIHYQKFLYRGLFFALACTVYIYARMTDQVGMLLSSPVSIVALAFIWIVLAVEMVSRLIPSPVESMGCEKQFEQNLMRTEVPDPILQSPKTTIAVALVWLGLNAVIGGLYIAGVLDVAEMILICLFYALADMICILFFCPFQTWIMKNKCCGTCRIYDWDYAMICTPLIFLPSLPSYLLLGLSLVVLITWEYRVKKHPERFSEATNAHLSCKNCPEKLCRHKKQLSHFLDENRVLLQAKGEFLTEKLRHDIAERQQMMKNNANKLASGVREKLPTYPRKNAPQSSQSTEDKENENSTNVVVDSASKPNSDE